MQTGGSEIISLQVFASHVIFFKSVPCPKTTCNNYQIFRQFFVRFFVFCLVYNESRLCTTKFLLKVKLLSGDRIFGYTLGFVTAYMSSFICHHLVKLLSIQEKQFCLLQFLFMQQTFASILLNRQNLANQASPNFASKWKFANHAYYLIPSVFG